MSRALRLPGGNGKVKLPVATVRTLQCAVDALPRSCGNCVLVPMAMAAEAKKCDEGQPVASRGEEKRGERLVPRTLASSTTDLFAHSQRLAP